MQLELQSTWRPAARRIHGAADRAFDLRPALSTITEEWIGSERRQFATGHGWPPLKRSTRLRKIRQGLGSSPMRATGRLERALTVRRARGQTVRMRRSSLVVGLKGGKSKVYYGRFHQRGRGVPQRKVVVFDEQARRRVAPILRGYIVHGSRSLRRAR